MVLSNKKLKHKLREKLAESLISSVAGKDSHGGVPGERKSESQPQSIKVLLGATSIHGSRLSKREKRRESLISTVSDGKNDEEMKESEVKRDKKRKRGEGEKEKDAADRLEADEEKARKLKRNKKNRKKKKKQKINKKAKNGVEEKEEEEKKGSADVNGVEGHVEESHDNIYSQVKENVSTKVYVGGIPYYSTEDDICSFFESCGTITDVDCMKFPESGKFRGIAILSFKTEAAVKRALAMDGSDMGGFFLKVQPYKGTRTTKAVDFSPGIVEGYNRIYLGNLSWDATEDDLKNLFTNCKIASIRFGMDKETGEFRGFAHIDFSDSVSLKTALKLDQETIHGRPVKIRCAVPKIGTVKGAAAAPPQPSALATSAPLAPTAAAPPAAAPPAPVTAETLPRPVLEMKEADGELSALSGKIKRRTCYECGEKGHLSSNCPMKEMADLVPRSEAAAPPAWAAVETLPKSVPEFEMKEADGELSAVSGKIKRRTCYECGEKGHLSSNCPNKQLAESVAGREAAAAMATAPALAPATAAAETLPKYVPEMKEADGGLSALSGKIKRRTCYECGEKGHLSSNCPNKQLENSVAGRQAAAPAPAVAETLPVPEMKEADNGLSALSGKIKRRKCYECGEKGHLSSDCPNKQLADSILK